ncbi:mannitol dehydrogenase family protein [Pseudovibrio sp. Tun.PSC04-5.I4]|uniref:mannitol dehydrogenase family protein n=1 Tax=Pseudovibrio sp. Tun.PSC04-5.I4 TaxID=1798213 RepID=UPI000889A401|nr:mannitol dehydrogenase family protein [Pseudovibrio sp. Tun.PSC04-5.I4]SDR48579.1 fructuronate reductase [Pseudovibrio sp. Tun.PSC04-5.I4]
MSVEFTRLDLAALPAKVELPSYDRKNLKPRIAHIGFGAFARAHTAMHLHETLAAAGGDWGMRVVELFGTAELFGKLAENDHLYTLVETSDEGTSARLLGAVCETQHVARDGVQAIIDGFAEEQLKIISLTVTEKGYCVKNGTLDTDNAWIQEDLKSPSTPKTAIGLIVAGLAKRRELGNGPITVMSCDNLPHNGVLTGIAVREFAAKVDGDLAAWIEENVSFPSTMVDRIVPALTDESRAIVRDQLGGQMDLNGIVCEPFRQWVVEDNFKAGRPQWEKAGAQLVADVEPFEEMKLRTLNGSHSFLAYLGFLAGKETISDCMADATYRAETRKLMVEEQRPTLEVPGDVDLIEYADMLLKRFANSQLKHRTWQIASDGTMKMPQRWLNSVRFHLKQGTDHSRLILGVGGWMNYIRADRNGESYEIQDPMKDKLAEIVATHGDDREAYVSALLALDSVFPADLVANESFTTAVRAAYAKVADKGAAQAVADLAN